MVRQVRGVDYRPVQEVLLCQHVTNPVDKIRCYTAQLSRLGSTKKTTMACNLCIEILHELGYSKIPSNSILQKVKAEILAKTG